MEQEIADLITTAQALQVIEDDVAEEAGAKDDDDVESLKRLAIVRSPFGRDAYLLVVSVVSGFSSRKNQGYDDVV